MLSSAGAERFLNSGGQGLEHCVCVGGGGVVKKSQILSCRGNDKSITS